MAKQAAPASVTPVEETDKTNDGELVQEKDYPALRHMMQILTMEAESAPDDNADEFVMSLMEKILSATTPEEIFAAQDSGMRSGQDFAGRPFYLAAQDISIRRSSIQEGGLPFYAMVKVTEIATGEEHVLNCGGKTFMSTLHGLRQIDYFNVTDEFPFGRSMTIIATPSPKGAYLSLKPFRMVAASSRAQK